MRRSQQTVEALQSLEQVMLMVVLRVALVVMQSELLMQKGTTQLGVEVLS
jgi:hypothetical protein